MEHLQTDNIIIAHIDDKAIIEDENGTLFYSVIPAEYVTIGETMFEDDLTPLSNLPIVEQYYIQQKLHEVK